MSLPIPKPVRPPHISTIPANNWEAGVVSLLDDGRTPITGLREASNCLLEQDGVIRPRPSLQKFGPQPAGDILGELFQYRSVSGLTTTNHLISMQKIARNEIQTLTITGTPTGGTFKLTFGGQQTGTIAFNASAATVQTALVALSTIGTGNVVCGGGALPGTGVTITFQGTLANTDVALLTSADTLTGGTSPATHLAETTKGGYVGHIHYALPEDTAWTEVTTADYSSSANAHFVQHDQKVVILNGSETLSYFDIDAHTITSFNAISNATAPTLTTNTGLTGTNFTVSYAVTANSTVGETSGAALDVSVSTDRDLWAPATQNIKIGWSTVTGVKSWNVYASVTADGSSNRVWGLLATGISADTLQFTDTGGGTGGTGPINTFRSLPTQNSTAGPAASRGEVINGQLFLTGDLNNPYYIWHDGGSGFELDFTVTNGGGFMQIGQGSREIPVKIWNFRSGPGVPQIKALSKGLNGSGKRYTISPTTITYGGLSATIWVPSEDYGFSGTDSPDALIVYGNSTYYPSRDGFRVVGTKPQLQNLLDNDTFSQTILPDLASLNNEAMDGAVGTAFEQRLYFALPVGESFNNQIWVNDLARKGAWMKPFSISATWLVVIADNDGYSHLVVVNGSNIYELSYSTLTTDDGIAFPTSGSTGLNYFSPDKQEWGRLIKVVITILRPQGLINFSLSGYTNKQIVEPLGIASLSASGSSSGYGWGEAGWSDFGWSDFAYTTNVTALISKDIQIKVNKDCKYWSLSWNSTQSGTDYSISELTPQFVPIGIKNLKN
jgi:hypothetical protein